MKHERQGSEADRMCYVHAESQYAFVCDISIASCRCLIVKKMTAMIVLIS